MKKKSNTILNILIVLLLGIMAFSGYKLFEIQKAAKEIAEQYEKLEQTILRQEYVDSIKRNMKAQLDNIEIERPDGTIEKLKPVYKKKK